MVEAVCEGVDERLQLGDLAGQVVAGIELVSPGALGALDGAVELGALGREDEEGKISGAAGLLEAGLELRSAVDLEPVTVKGASAMSLSRSDVAHLAVARVKTAATVHLATGS